MHHLSQRYLETQVARDLQRKMVFLGGPRQVGKTTLALRLLQQPQAYLNWDIAEHREAILRRELPDVPLLVFDEIHKYPRWRNYLKGLYDKNYAERQLGVAERQILVTGSARLDLQRKGGDSLQGRYHYLRLHPLSVAELGLQSTEDFHGLLQLGGFPEPYYGGSEVDALRWSTEYRTRLVREDVQTIEEIRDLGQIELLMLHLPKRVGSPLSIQSLAEDLQVAFKTVKRWLAILDRLYAVFALAPFGAPKLRAIKKSQKHYHYDWSLVRDKGPRFENLVASHLLKWQHFLQDTQGRDVELRYFRDKDGREVDFVLVEDGAPTHLIECKYADATIDKSLRYLSRKFPQAEAWQLCAEGSKEYRDPEGIRVSPAQRFLAGLA